ncbi:hypothetical protein [Roseofilum capinflatum]|uniref:Uncharacterized protein n=1 Tax=Roseofilum capinflatum BLCC-M114 TaxID=3022440 RepID=A0ABT7B6G2_9CYAN|nr:hypothetical protein [Roseofilum capinflatum]MDJ1174768.1 hypothetical protein [Roseofilum capinflatum BLCC-M114]
MLSGHIQATVERAKATDGEYLIAAQDTTYYNYSGQKQPMYLTCLEPSEKPMWSCSFGWVKTVT